MTTPPPLNTDRLPRDPSQSPLDELCINTIRCLAMDAVQKAKSGHPGMPMGMAPAGYVLWTRHLRYNPANPRWVNRDRFILSAGHGCMLLYSLLHLTGYDLSLEEITNFRQWGSRTPGHPEYGLTPGVEVTTGPLGQGLANAVGIALAGKYLARMFNREQFPVIDFNVYVFAGDGCLQEGVGAEASSLAGHLGLDNLIVIYDDNRISIDGPTSLSFTEDVAERYRALGWFVQVVDGDGNDLAAIDRALQAAKAERERPSLIKLRTHIGYGSPRKQDSSEAHGSPLGDEEVAATKVRYGWDPSKTFVEPPEALAFFRHQGEKGAEVEAGWTAMFRRYADSYPDLGRQFLRAAERKLPENWPDIVASLPEFPAGSGMATREAQGKVLDVLMPQMPMVLGGSADLTPSNNTRFHGAQDFTSTNRDGRYVRYGVREHAMAAMMNGMTVTDLVIPYGGTFFCFSDYMRPSIRLAALSEYPTIFVFTHDSIGLGEDGPTHQAVEQLAALRAIPGLVVIRPADANETRVAWTIALERRHAPTALVLSRQKIPVLDRTKVPAAAGISRGGYLLVEHKNPAGILIGSGSEVHLALKAGEMLSTRGIQANVVNLASWELFEEQPESYRESVFPPMLTVRVGVEAGVRQGWDHYIGSAGGFVGMSGFGASAPGEVAFRNFGITADHIVDEFMRMMK